jgi:vacuolar-type H+-ATPase subunit F/Vma7
VVRVAVLGERALVEGYALGGARVLPADSPEEVRAAWATLAPDVAVLLLTPAAAGVLGPSPAAAGVPGPSPVAGRRPLLVVLPR